jgi:hypothetical protein
MQVLQEAREHLSSCKVPAAVHGNVLTVQEKSGGFSIEIKVTATVGTLATAVAYVHDMHARTADLRLNSDLHYTDAATLARAIIATRQLVRDYVKAFRPA